MTQTHNKLLQHFIEGFYAAYTLEEQSLLKTTNPSISFRESHILSTIFDLTETNENMSTIIAAKSFMQRPALSLTLSSLERKGYIERVHSKDDRRNVFVQLTDGGTSVLQQHREFQQQFVKDYLEGFPEDKREVVQEVITSLRDFFIHRLDQ